VAEFYKMPQASPTMELGTLVAWRVAEGETFQSQTVMAEVGTDKANMEVEIFDPGVLIKHLIQEGAEVPAGYPIAIIGKTKDENIDELLKEFEQVKVELATPQEAPAETAPATPEPVVQKTAPAIAPPVKVEPRSWMGNPLPPLFLEPPGDIRAAKTETRVLASPLAKAMAKDLGISLQRIKGTGPGGRVVKADVERAGTRGGGRAIHGPPPPDQALRNSPMRKTIARRLLESHQDIPTFYLTATLDMQGFVDLRKALKAGSPDQKISYNDLLIKAVALALRESPQVNASWSAESIHQLGRVDVGVAVALPDGLITPVIRNADQKSIFDIAAEVRELATKAKEGKLKPEEYTGGTFTISNLGMYGIDQFTAIINPPEAAILAAGGIMEVPIAQDGTVGTGWQMKVTMTCDHRVIDGAVGAQFLLALRKLVETPYLLLI
jgi:pyruvate dehydrogenase E2 component (dihydrolipoamide acetyltransferase)